MQLDGIDYDRRRHDAVHLRREQPVLREAAGRRPGGRARRARSSTSRSRRRYYTDSARGAVRPAVRDQLHRRAAEPLLADRAERPRACRPTTSTRRSRAEFDSRYHALRTISASGTYALAGPRADHRRLEQAGLHRAARRASTIRTRSISPSTRRPTCTRGTTRSAASTRSTTTCCSATMLQQRISGFYNAQCCGIAFEYQTYNFGGVSRRPGARRSSLLPVVHARRPRQLLAVQRRDERRAALTATGRCRPPTLVTGAAGFAGSHLLDLLDAATAPTSSRGTARAAPPPATRRPAITWEAVDLLDRGGRARRDRARCGRRPCTTAPARRTSGGRGTTPSRRFADQRARHASPARSAARARRSTRASLIPELGDGLRGRRPRRSTEDDPLVPASPYGAEQAGAGDARRAARTRRRAGHHRARVQPLRPAAGSVVRRVRLRAAHRRHRSGTLGAGDRRSATSTRGAI